LSAETNRIAAVYIHPTAIVESDRIGAGTRIWAFTHILAGAVIGMNCNVSNHGFIEAGAVIGRLARRESLSDYHSRAPQWETND